MLSENSAMINTAVVSFLQREQYQTLRHIVSFSEDRSSRCPISLSDGSSFRTFKMDRSVPLGPRLKDFKDVPCFGGKFYGYEKPVAFVNAMNGSAIVASDAIFLF